MISKTGARIKFCARKRDTEFLKTWHFKASQSVTLPVEVTIMMHNFLRILRNEQIYKSANRKQSESQ